jgi:hypothetical protein
MLNCRIIKYFQRDLFGRSFDGFDWFLVWSLWIFQGFSTTQTFSRSHSEFIKRAYNEIINHTGKEKDFYFSEMGSTLCIVDFLSRHERRGYFIFLKMGASTSLHITSYFVMSVQSKIIKSFSLALVIPRIMKIRGKSYIVASANTGGTKLPVKV